MADEERLINAYTLADNIHKSKLDNPHTDIKVARNHDFEHEHFLKMVCLAPTVDAVKVIHAKWEYHGRNDEYFCSNCYKQPISFKREMNCGVGELVEVCFSDYCPNCGAKMKQEDGERREGE